MEDHTPQLSAPENISARSATALRQIEDRARAALAASRQRVSRLETELTAQVDAIAATLAEEHAEHASRDEWKEQLAEVERKLGQQQAAWDEQRSQWSVERTALERERDELQQKFELVLEDVGRFRGRIADLEQELARRPEVNQTDSAELVALRAERDALCARVGDLEREPSHPFDADAEQQAADLRRRFELAVEDVRELKTKNAQLETQLAEPRKQTAGGTDSGAMDWESQKRRLLASLEDGGDGGDDAVGQDERATIQGTIEMTDAIVAEKDREIAELKAQLAGGDKPADADAERNRKIDDMIDGDQVIAEHRQRIAQLERETQDKLRATELELSLERAKLARQKAELENLRAELESQRSALGAENGTATAPGVPRRRWLSKLGLSGDES